MPQVLHSDSEFVLSYATVLRHLRILNQEGYIELYKEGRTLYAKIKENSKQIQNLNAELEAFKNLNEKTLVTKNESKISHANRIKEAKKG